MNTNCPICNEHDRVQKVSSIVTSGITSEHLSGPVGAVTYSKGNTSYSGGYSVMSGASVTGLAALLTPLPEPTKKSAMGCGNIAFLIFGEIFISYLFYAIVFEATRKLNSGIIAAVIVGVAFLIGMIIYLINKSKDVEKTYQEEKAVWDKQIGVWMDLYYCFRDDVVFFPETGQCFHPAQLHSFLESL